MAEILRIHSTSISLDGSAHQLSSDLSQQGWSELVAAVESSRGSNLLVTLASTHCVPASFPVRRRKGGSVTREAVGFAFEEHAPIAVEKCRFDFADRQSSVFAVATEEFSDETLERLRTTTNVVGCVPEALLIADGVLATLPRESCLLVFRHEASCHIFECLDRRICSWRSTSTDDASVSRELAAYWLTADEPTEIVVTNRQFSSNLLGPNFRHVVQDFDVESVRQQAADDVVSGRLTPTIDFLRSGSSMETTLRPIQRALTASLAVISACVIGIGVVLLHRAWQHEVQAEEYRDQQVELFRKLNPGERIPPGINRHLESALQARKSLSGGSGELPPDPEVLTRLHAVLSRLPADSRFLVEGIQISNTMVSMETQVRSAADAIGFAKALRETGMNVPTPGIEQTRNGVTRFNLRLLPPSEEQGE